MANFPTSTPTDYNTTGSEVLNSAASVGLSAVINAFSDEIIALANKVGTGSATPTATTLLVGDGVGTSTWTNVLPAIDMNGATITLDADGDTSIKASTDDIIDFTTSSTIRARVSNSGLFVLSGSFYADTIAEYSAGNGVTVDGLSIKDSKLNTNDSVVTANITDSAVTAAKINASAVTTAKINDSAVTTAKINAGAVTAAKRAAFDRRNHTTNTTTTAPSFEYGWVYVDAGTSSSKDVAVTFPTAYSSAPIVFVTSAGRDASGTPAAIGDFDTTKGNSIVHTLSVTTSGFTIRFATGDGTNYANQILGAAWLAIGAA